jgi:prepilin signal peptidase PulO-like enzyme (type II secretory pathway)
VDSRKLIIPDGFIVLGLLIAAFGLPWARDLSAFDAGMGSLLGGGSFVLIRNGYRSFRGREGMGDEKLAALAGVNLGVRGWIQATVLGSLTGVAVGLGLILTRRSTWKTPLPYGAFLALTAIAVLFGIGRPP